MALQVQQEQLPIHLSGRRGSGFALWLAARELNLLAVDGYVLKVVISWSNFGNQLSFVWVFPSLISVEINMEKIQWFLTRIVHWPSHFCWNSTKRVVSYRPMFYIPDVMEAETASTCRGWLHFAWKSFLHFPRVGWGPESRRLMKHWANGQTFQQFFWISLRSFYFIFGSFGLMREMRETWHDQQPHVMIAWDMKEAEQLGW